MTCMTSYCVMTDDVTIILWLYGFLQKELKNGQRFEKNDRKNEWKDVVRFSVLGSFLWKLSATHNKPTIHFHIKDTHLSQCVWEKTLHFCWYFICWCLSAFAHKILNDHQWPTLRILPGPSVYCYVFLLACLSCCLSFCLAVFGSVGTSCLSILCFMIRWVSRAV